MPAPGMLDGPSMHHSTRGWSFNNSKPYYRNIKQAGRGRGLAENNALKTFVPDKEKASNVAKIKVVINLGIFMEDNKTEFLVLVDRSVGGSSVADGQIELMLYRVCRVLRK